MYWEEPKDRDAIPISGLSRAAMTLLLVANIVLGVYPQPILRALIATVSASRDNFANAVAASVDQSLSSTFQYARSTKCRQLSCCCVVNVT